MLFHEDKGVIIVEAKYDKPVSAYRAGALDHSVSMIRIPSRILQPLPSLKFGQADMRAILHCLNRYVAVPVVES